MLYFDIMKKYIISVYGSCCQSALCGHPIATISESWTRGEACSNTTTPASHTRISAYDKTLINVYSKTFCRRFPSKPYRRGFAENPFKGSLLRTDKKPFENPSRNLFSLQCVPIPPGFPPAPK